MSTKIEWCEETWNPITGCSPTSEGCQNCYAKRMAQRLAGRFGYDKKNPFKPTLHYDKLDKPLSWRKLRMIFVSSMGDLFYEDVPDVWIDEVVQMMMVDNRHRFLLLTKRPKRMKQYVMDKGLCECDWIWLGVTAENQKRWDERVPVLMSIPHAGPLFVSVEPMLGRIIMGNDYPNWVICGAETGPRARCMNPDWAIDLMVQCDEKSIPFFMKKMSKGDNPKTYGLNVREYPRGKVS